MISFYIHVFYFLLYLNFLEAAAVAPADPPKFVIIDFVHFFLCYLRFILFALFDFMSFILFDDIRISCWSFYLKASQPVTILSIRIASCWSKCCRTDAWSVTYSRWKKFLTWFSIIKLDGLWFWIIASCFFSRSSSRNRYKSWRIYLYYQLLIIHDFDCKFRFFHVR